MAEENLSELVQVKTTPAQKDFLDKWAKSEDRPVSYLIRKLIEAERVRRASQNHQVHQYAN